jgi:hypothetical protein
MHQCVYTFLIVGMKIPEHIPIWNISSWMAFMAPIHAWELYRIADEEDWQIIEDKLLVTFLGEQSHSPSANIAHGIA